MKHLPNLLTLANLFCGCIAITFILNSQPFLANYGGMEYWVTGTEQAYMGSLFILLAGLFDVLDGFTARLLKVFSPIGKDLDSLADIVSFGVAPSMILFKMLWACAMSQPDALDASMLAMSPAFLTACFGALRLARFNINSTGNSNSFTGMPIPAAGIFIASFPLLNFYNPMHIGSYLQNKWMIYAVIALLCWFMVSRIHFLKLIPAKWQLNAAWPQYLLIIAGIAGLLIMKIAAVPFLFILYIILSLVYKPKEAQ